MSLIWTDCPAISKFVLRVVPGGRQKINKIEDVMANGLMVPGCGEMDVDLGSRASDADALSSRRSSSQ